MKQLLLTGFLLPLLIQAQVVQPVLNDEYRKMIAPDSAQIKMGRDSSNSFAYSRLRTGNYYGLNNQIQKIKISPSGVVVTEPVVTRLITIKGNISSVAEIQKVNRMPALQQEYAQGRNVNSSLAWRGAETDELFSYGPSLKSLEFDGSPYPYDVNGRLVPIGTGNGKQATVYNSSIFRTGMLVKNNAFLQAKYKKGHQDILTAAFRTGQTAERNVMQLNKNSTAFFGTSLESRLNNLTLNGSYNYSEQKAAHNNRNSFLNRAYQNSLLTPVSFDNRQGTVLVNRQRSYSLAADNPFFLLSNLEHAFMQQQHTASIVAEQRIRRTKIRLAQSLERLHQYSDEGYEESTAFILAGTDINRHRSDKSYQLYASATQQLPSRGSLRNAPLSFSYIFNSNQTAINYNQIKQYNYQRSAHDVLLSFSPDFRFGYVAAGATAVNKMYFSNTVSKASFFLPAVSAWVVFYKPFDVERISVRATAGYNRFNNELPINKSYAASALLKHRVADNLFYLPVTEVNSFKNVDAVRNYEYTAAFEINHHRGAAFSINWFNRLAKDDIFPVWNASELVLKNIAAHRTHGFETELTIPYKLGGKHQFDINQRISFSKYNSKVTDVTDWYDQTPLAGFSDVHTAIVKGQPLGVITGNAWLRDAQGNSIIGNDGFPTATATQQVVGNPIPDFVMKFNNRISYKNKVDLSFDIEWKKGGDRWNGTEALLDYYGRSAGSGMLRHTTGYVFDGAKADGTKNNTPVSFYDASLPFIQNRWVRYGHGGVAEAYIQRADYLRLNAVNLSYKKLIKKQAEQYIVFAVYANNILFWSPYKGADVNQLLNDSPGASGLDFFNLPAVRSFGFNVSLQF